MRLQVGPLPASRDHSLAVFGGGRLSPAAAEMAALLGQEIVAAGYCLVTDGRSSAAVACATGALGACRAKGLDPREAMVSIYYAKAPPLVAFGSSRRIDRSQTKRRCAMVQSTWGAFVIGGEKQTRDDLMIATLEAIVEGYALLLVPGTGGLADRICLALPPLEDPAMNAPEPTGEKARKLVTRLLESPCWICDIDPMVMHDRWFVHPLENDNDRAMFHIRHKYF